MLGMLYLLGTFFANLFKPQRRLEIENLFLHGELLKLGFESPSRQFPNI